MTEWRVHVGAHKTATTHLQLTLQAAKPRINALGGDFLPLDIVRPLACAADGPWSRRLARRAPAVYRLLLRRQGAALRHGLSEAAQVSGPLALSEENFLKDTRSCFASRVLYPHLDRMRPLARLSRHAPLKIFLTLRSLDGFLPSAYAQALKETRFSRADFRAAAADFAGQAAHWTGLVARLREIMPEADFEVWDFDDYESHWRTLHRSLLGVALDDFPDIPPPIDTRTPGDVAVAAAEALEIPAGPMRATEVLGLYAEDIRTGASPRFNPLSAEEKAHFRRLYAEDLATLQTRFPGVLKTF